MSWTLRGLAIEDFRWLAKAPTVHCAQPILCSKAWNTDPVAEGTISQGVKALRKQPDQSNTLPVWSKNCSNVPSNYNSTFAGKQYYHYLDVLSTKTVAKKTKTSNVVLAYRWNKSSLSGVCESVQVYCKFNGSKNTDKLDNNWQKKQVVVSLRRRKYTTSIEERER